MKEKIKKIIIILTRGNLFLLIGLSLFIYGLFSFDSSYYCGRTEKEIHLFELPSLDKRTTIECLNPATYYYYSDENKVLLVMGILLITIDLLKRKREQ